MIRFILLLVSINSYSKPIKLTQVQDLEFGILVQGDSSKIISPNTNNPNSAVFDVTGDKNTSYSILLPTQMSISLNGSGSNPIIINNFKSIPAAGANGLLDKKGRQTIGVGATLTSVNVTQPPGNYFGTFTVDVIY